MSNKNSIHDPKSTYAHLLKMPDAFSREDESDDTEFYSRKRIIQHLDSEALKTVKKLIGELIIEDHPAILDLMASIDSHIPEDLHPDVVIGLGLNEEELEHNKALDQRIIHDLNRNPELPFDDNQFDAVINTVSIQYLTEPKKIFDEVARVLRPGGLHLVIFSNRTFSTKSIKIWDLMTDDERVEFIRAYFKQTNLFHVPQVFISMGKPRPRDDKYADSGFPSDPIFAVYAQKIGKNRSGKERPRPESDNIETQSIDLKDYREDMIENRKCPYCGSKLHTWGITDNPMTTWDHDLLVCINDACPYLVKGWKEMYDQGNRGFSYRLTIDPRTGNSVPVPVPNLSVIKSSLKD